MEIRGHYSISRRFLLGWGPWSRFGGREGFDMFWVTTSPAFWTQSLLPCPNSPQTALGGTLSSFPLACQAPGTLEPTCA